jgi:hypothetical protein
MGYASQSHADLRHQLTCVTWGLWVAFPFGICRCTVDLENCGLCNRQLCGGQTVELTPQQDVGRVCDVELPPEC